MVGVGLGPWAVVEAGRAAWARTQTVVTLGGDCMVGGVLCTRGGYHAAHSWGHWAQPGHT